MADSAYAGGELKKLPAAVTWTTRLRKDAALHGLPPAARGGRGQLRTKVAPTPAALANNPGSRTTPSMRTRSLPPPGMAHCRWIPV